MTEKSDAIGIARFLSNFDYDSYRYEFARPEDKSTLKSVAIVEGMNTNVLPLNVFYVHSDKIDHYRSEFDLEVQRNSRH